MVEPATGYAPPLDQLLTLGDIRPMKTWPDYLALGLGAQQIPDLIRMATDPALNDADSDSPEVWAPIHAWRTLGLLHAVEAVEPLLGLLQRADTDDDDWVMDDLPRAFGVLGPEAVPALAQYLLDTENGMWARLAAAQSLTDIALQHPDSGAICGAALTIQLKQFADEDPTFNGFIISNLVELKGVEAQAAMEGAFKAGAVDTTVQGDWDAVRHELGLVPSRPTSKAVFEARFERAVLAAQPQLTPKRKRKRHKKRK